MQKGIDISYWQGNTDLQKAKSAGVQFVILREGYRKTIDKKFTENVRKAKEAGLPVAVYHFIYTDGATTIENAQATVEHMKQAGLDVSDTWVFADLEYDTWKKNGETCTREKCSLYTLEYIRALQSLGCARIGVYMNLDYYKNYYTDEIKNGFPVWLADYTGGADYSCSLQQYSSTGRVSGISGSVDMNYLYDDTMFTTDKNKETGGKNNMYDRTKVIQQARAWLGCNESNGTHRQIIDVYNTQNPRPRGYKVQYSDAWCATFVSAVAVKLGYTAIIPTECSCNYMIQGFKNIGCWVENDAYTPKAGDVIFYDWQDSGAGDNVGSSDHVGIVESCDGTTITVIEGNISNSVGRRTLRVNGRYIRGFGVPKYNTQSAGNTSGNASGGASGGNSVKSVEQVAREVINGVWGTGDDRRARLTSAGYDYNAVQKRVNAILAGHNTPTKSVDDVAREVLAGKWGNGDDRRNRLTVAGYNYTEVQNAVNKLVNGNRKSVEQVAREVIAGKWGNGSERKRRLQNAGYDYNAVQRIVNRLL